MLIDKLKGLTAMQSTGLKIIINPMTPKKNRNPLNTRTALKKD